MCFADDKIEKKISFWILFIPLCLFCFSYYIKEARIFKKIIYRNKRNTEVLLKIIYFLYEFFSKGNSTTFPVYRLLRFSLFSQK